LSQLPHQLAQPPAPQPAVPVQTAGCAVYKVYETNEDFHDKNTIYVAILLCLIYDKHPNSQWAGVYCRCFGMYSIRDGTFRNNDVIYEVEIFCTGGAYYVPFSFLFISNKFCNRGIKD
jgi:hypothetical protein